MKQKETIRSLWTPTAGMLTGARRAAMLLLTTLLLTMTAQTAWAQEEVLQSSDGDITVSLNAQGGSGGTESVTPTSGEAMPEITPPTYTGYTFGGYYTEQNGGGTQYYNADGTSAHVCDLTGTVTLYAKWTANEYTVTFDQQGGSGPESVTATYGSDMPLLNPVPSRIGYEFVGYYTEVNGGGVKYYNANGMSARTWGIDANTTLYAYWKKQLSNDNITIEIPAQTYNGSELTPVVTVKDNGSEVSDEHYNIDLPEGRTNAGDYLITITAKEGSTIYTGSKTATFTISKAPLTVTAKDHIIFHGNAAANNGVTYSGFVNDETENDLGGELTYTYSNDNGFYGTDNDAPGDYQITPGGLTSNNYEITFVPGTLTVNLTNIVTQSNFYYYFDEDGELQDNVTFDELIFQGEFSGLVSYITLDRPITITGYKKNTGDTENTDDKAVLNDIAFVIAAADVTLQNMKLVATSNLGNLIDIACENAVISNMDISYTVDEAASAINVYPGANGTQIVNNKIYFESTVQEYTMDDVTTAICVDSGVSIFDDEDPIEGLVVDGNEITVVIPAFLADVYENEYYVMGISAVNGVRINGAEYFQFTNNTLNVTTNWLYKTTPTFQGMYVASSSGSINANTISMIDTYTPQAKDVYLYAMELIYDEDLTISDNDFNISTTGGKEEAGSACAIVAIESDFSISDNTITTESKGPNYAVYFPSNMVAPCDAVISDNTINVTGLATSAHDTGLVSGIEIQTGNVEISGNTICTYNIGEYAEDNYIYGISYAQDGVNSNWTITDNTIYTEGKYAISLKSANDAEITENALCAHELFGDDAVYIASGSRNTVENNLLGYVMPKTGESTYDIPANVSSFKVFDDGGQGRIYSPGCDGTLTLNAPTGYVLQLSGNITTEKDVDYLTVYDGSDNQADVLIDQESSSVSGELTDIPTVTSTGQSITLHFCSDNSVSDISEYDGLDLTVSLISPATLFAADATNKWMTWCDKYAYVKPKGVTVYTVSSVATDKVTLAEVSGGVIPAYTPVLLYREAAGDDAVTATFSAVGTEPEIGYDSSSGIVEANLSNNVTLYGNFGDGAYASGDNNNIFAVSESSAIQSYVLLDGQFVLVDYDEGISAHRCWLNVTKSTTNGARLLSIDTDSESTGIETTNFTNSANSSDAWYGIDGRKLDGKPTKKGLYIYNGKKQVIK